jgi:hypothetical protein
VLLRQYLSYLVCYDSETMLDLLLLVFEIACTIVEGARVVVDILDIESVDELVVVGTTTESFELVVF